MPYKCLNCGWTGQWYELIHETMCPKCRCSAMRVRDKKDSMRHVLEPDSTGTLTSTLTSPAPQ